MKCVPRWASINKSGQDEEDLATQTYRIKIKNENNLFGTESTAILASKKQHTFNQHRDSFK